MLACWVVNVMYFSHILDFGCWVKLMVVTDVISYRHCWQNWMSSVAQWRCMIPWFVLFQSDWNLHIVLIINAITTTTTTTTAKLLLLLIYWWCCCCYCQLLELLMHSKWQRETFVSCATLAKVQRLKVTLILRSTLPRCLTVPSSSSGVYCVVSVCF